MMNGKETFVFKGSSNLESAEYDPEEQELTISFRSGDEYTYSNVPMQTYASLIQAPSAGKFFHRQIKDRYSFS